MVRGIREKRFKNIDSMNYLTKYDLAFGTVIGFRYKL